MTHMLHIDRKLREALHDPLEPENVRLISTLYWRLLVVLFVCAALLAILYGVGKFGDAQQLLDNASSPTTAVHAPFDRAAFDAAVAAFDVRQVRYQSLQALPLTISDPSK